MEARIEALEKRVEILEKRVESLEANVRAMRISLDDIRDTVLLKLVEVITTIAKKQLSFNSTFFTIL